MAGRREDIWNQYWKLQGGIDQIDPATENRFDNYKDPFGFQDQNKQLGGLYDSFMSDINRSTQQNIASGARATSASMASQGITGGSLLNSQLGANRDNANMNRFNAVNKLNQQRTSDTMNLMKDENDRGFRNTQSAQNVDLQNIANLFQKYGLLQNNTNSMNNSLNGWEQSDYNQRNEPGWFDDVLSVANTVAQFIPGGGSNGGGNNGGNT